MKTINDDAAARLATQAAIYGTGKIQPHHRERLAVVYVRQSTARQVLEHCESTALQYGLADRAVQLGWQKDRVLVIDDDLGQSGSTAENRLGFRRLLAEVSLDHVGIVLGIEMSRLARSNRDWHQLLDLCAVFRCILADQDGLYDPSCYNDRLLLGLKGTMSEAELHILRARMDEGKRNKARRGELFSHQPIGYIRLPSGDVRFDPDEQAQSVVKLIFEKFEELGSGRRLFHYLLEQGIRIPVRSHSGPQQGQLEWRTPCNNTLYGMLHNPQYAGAYSYGRNPTNPRRKKPGRNGTGKVRAPMDQWLTLLRDHLPAYITWEQYLANQKRLQQNCAGFETLGATREGPSLLGGLVCCGCCGRRMYVAYHDKPMLPRYTCQTDAPLRPGECENQNLAARVVDELVSQLVLKAIEPAAVELTLQAESQMRTEQQRLTKHWQQKLERAHYQTERARRQYDAVEPENRLVARELERCWDRAMLDERKIQEEHARFCHQHSGELTADERQQICALSSTIATLWDAATSTPQDRQEIVRMLIDKVVVRVHERTEFVDVTVNWAGGYVSQHEVRRPVGCYEQLRDYDQLLARITELRDAGKTATKIAEQLNTEGFHSPRCEHRFNQGSVRQLLSRAGLTRRPGKDAGSDSDLRQPNEWWMRDLALELKIPFQTLCAWCRAGWVHARKVTLAYRRWVVWADVNELDRLRRLRDYQRSGPHMPYPVELKTPTPRADS